MPMYFIALALGILQAFTTDKYSESEVSVFLK